jgi:PAS domain S-box-containing protein
MPPNLKLPKIDPDIFHPARSRRVKINHTYRYTLSGIIFGSFFIFLALIIELLRTDLMPTLANITQIHLNHPIMFVVDTAPFVLGTSFYFIGKIYQRLYNRSTELETSRAQFNALMDSAFDAIILIDSQGEVKEFNLAAEAIFGYKRQEAVGKNLAELIIPHRYREAHHRGMKMFLETGEGPLIGQRAEIAALHHDGHEFPVEIAIEKQNVVAQDFGDVSFVGFIHDITKRKEAAAQIIQASKLATLGEMATSVAHELNQPLNVIRLAVGNIRRKISKGTADPEYLNDKLERIEGQTTRAAAIIAHMRIFGREAKEAPVLIDPRDVVTNALALMGEQLRLAGIAIVTELPEDCPYILCHTIQLEQVILNLLTNARDAIAENNREAKITLRVFDDDQGVHITAEDTGGGIPEDALPRIFEPFYTTKPMGKGTGLGLSVGYGIIRDAGGTIAAENINDGARFTITLPIVS